MSPQPVTDESGKFRSTSVPARATAKVTGKGQGKGAKARARTATVRAMTRTATVPTIGSGVDRDDRLGVERSCDDIDGPPMARDGATITVM
jgi:hypothetical protein